MFMRQVEEKFYSNILGCDVWDFDYMCEPWVEFPGSVPQIKSMMAGVRFHGLRTIVLPVDPRDVKLPYGVSINPRTGCSHGRLFYIDVSLGGVEVLLSAGITGPGDGYSVQPWTTTPWGIEGGVTNLDNYFGSEQEPDDMKVPQPFDASVGSRQAFALWHFAFCRTLAEELLDNGYLAFVNDLEELVPTLNRTWDWVCELIPGPPELLWANVDAQRPT